MQTADDLDDIEFGIQKLLEAKDIRLKGREELHPWFEDIYLKLGLAYQKAGKMNEAKEYFETVITTKSKRFPVETMNSYMVLSEIAQNEEKFIKGFDYIQE